MVRVPQSKATGLDAPARPAASAGATTLRRTEADVRIGEYRLMAVTVFGAAPTATVTVGAVDSAPLSTRQARVWVAPGWSAADSEKVQLLPTGA